MPERVRFDEESLGTIWGQPLVDGVSERLKGSQWWDVPVPRMARVGDAVEVFEYAEQRAEP